MENLDFLEIFKGLSGIFGTGTPEKEAQKAKETAPLPKPERFAADRFGQVVARHEAISRTITGEKPPENTVYILPKKTPKKDDKPHAVKTEPPTLPLFPE